MNYRHAYHAGNFADVVKHLALVSVLGHLKRKAEELGAEVFLTAAACCNV